MVNPTTIASLPAANTPLVGNEYVAIVQGGITKNVTVNAFTSAAAANSVVAGNGITVTTVGAVSTIAAKTATSSILGIVQPDNTTITVAAGVITAVQSGVTSFTGDGTVYNNSASTGVVTGTLATQTKNTVLVGPTTGSNATPTFRALVGADIPVDNASITVSSGTIKANYGLVTAFGVGSFTPAVGGVGVGFTAGTPVSASALTAVYLFGANITGASIGFNATGDSLSGTWNPLISVGTAGNRNAGLFQRVA